jgi:2-dehydro-3-deoxygluconokinase
MTRIACIGECMIELSPEGERTMRLAYAGDVCNTAVSLARLSRGKEIVVQFVTRLGDERHSDAMLASWSSEGIDTGLVDRLEGRAPGLYLIELDERGERSFTYYRSESAARALFADDAHAGAVRDGLDGAGWVFLSGVTVSLLGAAAHERLLATLDALRAQGTLVAFDTNYRPRGWPEAATARERIAAVLDRCDLALPTLDDERALFGDRDVDECLARLAGHGVGEVAVKLGDRGACVASAGATEHVAPAADVEIVDTTGAGDAFDAGYLHARIVGLDPVAAAREGNDLAAVVLGHRGAIAPESAVPAAAARRNARATAR